MIELMIYEFNEYIPVVHESSFVHHQASLIGNVIIGKDVYIGPGARIRGDWGQIVIEDGCNVQENCTIHMFPGTKVHLKSGAHIGHGAIIHGATIGENCLVGMNSVVMDDCIIGANCILGALSLVTSKMEVPDGKILLGNPAKIIKDVSNEMLDWKSRGTVLYKKLPSECQNSLRECQALRELPENRPLQQEIYKNWKKSQ